MIKILYTILLAIILLFSTGVYASPYCGALRSVGQYGPYDYTNAEHRANKLPIVEGAHFTKNIERLISGNTGTVGAELNYTLHAFPNHHRALNAMSKLAFRDKTQKPIGARYTALCYFDRAVRFNPNDPIVYTLFANHLLKLGKIKLAQQKLEVAEKLDPENANIKYNLGLLYFKKKKYDKAMSYAKKAYGLGFPLPGLRNKLKRVEKWTN